MESGITQLQPKNYAIGTTDIIMISGLWKRPCIAREPESSSSMPMADQ